MLRQRGDTHSEREARPKNEQDAQYVDYFAHRAQWEFCRLFGAAAPKLLSL
jgi:hypothetical protein